MGKKILLEMDNEKDITILVDEEIKSTIHANDRKMNAKEIYEVLEYKIGDKYSISTSNESKRDPDVLQFFYELFYEIIESINDIEIELEEDC